MRNSPTFPKIPQHCIPKEHNFIPARAATLRRYPKGGGGDKIFDENNIF